jgi:hypothetical protein
MGPAGDLTVPSIQPETPVDDVMRQWPTRSAFSSDTDFSVWDARSAVSIRCGTPAGTINTTSPLSLKPLRRRPGEPVASGK